jgi:hypothetical protein
LSNLNCHVVEDKDDVSAEKKKFARVRKSSAVFGEDDDEQKQ